MSLEDELESDLKRYEKFLEENRDVADEDWWKELYEIYFHIKRCLNKLKKNGNS
jgi:hypothetical protein